jgi:LysR family transcriptional regulator, flagellar master operon regulator
VDIDLLKTFLEVKNTRHFGRAAENLYLTQAAVSARVKQLEKVLGTPLFTRYRNNIQLTPTGKRLVPHAEAMLDAWERAREDVAQKHEQKFVFAIGSTIGLWDLCLQAALPAFYEKLTNVSIRAEALGQDGLIRRLMERTLDVAVIHEPAKTNDLISREMPAANLILVSTVANCAVEQAINSNYVAVDWGLSFDVSYTQALQINALPIMHTPLARIALDFILACGGCAYLPSSLVEPHMGTRLHRVNDAPIIPRPFYIACHRENRHSEIAELLVEVVLAQSKS